MPDAEPIQLPGCLPPGFTIESQLKPEQAAIWLQMTERDLNMKATRDEIPHLRLGYKTIRYCPLAFVQLAQRKIK